MKKLVALVSFIGCFGLHLMAQEVPPVEDSSTETTEPVVSEVPNGGTTNATNDNNANVVINDQEAKALEYLRDVAKKQKVREEEKIQEAKAHFDHGVALFKKNLYESALTAFNKAVTIHPDYEEAVVYRDKTAAILGHRRNEVEINKTNLENITQVKETEKLIEIKNHLDNAKSYQDKSTELAGQKREGLTDEDKLDQRIKYLNQALQQYRKTKEMLQWVDIGPDKIKEFNEKIEKEEKAISIEKMSIVRELEDLKRKGAVEQAKKENELAQELIEKRLEAMKEAAEEAYKRGSYVQCQKICREILKLDPTSKSAVRLRDKARSKQFKLNERYIEKNAEEEYKRWEENNLRDMIPWNRPIVYSEDWDFIDQRSAIKNKQKRVSNWEQKILGILDQKGTFDWSQQPLADVLNEIRDNFPELSITLQKNALENLGITDQEPVDLKVTDLPLKHILKLMLSGFGLTYGLVSETLVISDEKGVQGELTLERYDVRDLTVTIGNFPGPDMSLNNSTGIGDSGGLGDVLGDVGDDAVEEITAENIAELIQSKINSNAWDDDRGTSIVVNRGQLLVTQSHEMHLLIEEFLERLRRTRATQVAVNTRFIKSLKNDLETIGVNWQGLDQATLDDAGRGNDQAGFLTDVTNLDNVDGRAGVFTGAPISAAGQNGLLAQFAVLGNTQYEAVLSALETKSNVNTMTAPRILVYNNQLAHIAVIEQQNYISDVNVTDGSLDSVVTSFFHGIVLEVRPTISSNRKYITLQISPVIRDLLDLETIQILSSQIFGLNIQAQTPVVQTIAVQTTVAIPDRGVMVIGSMARVNESKQTSGIPILSKIPLLGRLFRTDTTTSDKENILILVNAEIILLEEVEGNL